MFLMSSPVLPSSQGGDLRCERQGDTFLLTPERALWRAATRTLYIADPHFGKAAVYRGLGQPVPGGTTAQTLVVLDRVLRRFEPDALVILGDFLHARGAQGASTIDALVTWRTHWPDLACVLVRGNHDARAGDPPAVLAIETVNAPWIDAGLAACHEPPSGLASAAMPSAAVAFCATTTPFAPRTTSAVSDSSADLATVRYTLAGHIHPVVSLRGGGRDSLRLPCFDMGPKLGVLPAFGAFTGGWPVIRQPGHMLGVIADDRVLAYGDD